MINSYLSDEPVVDLDGDLLGRRPYAIRIAETIIARTNTAGLVIGLFGKWGDGKSSLLNMIAQRIEEEAKPTQDNSASDKQMSTKNGNTSEFAVMRFNPWYVRGEEQLVVAFFAELGAKVRMKLGKGWRKIAKTFGEYGGLAAALTPVGSEIVKAAADAVVDLAEQSIEERRQKVEDELKRIGVRIVVLVDDIDRLDRDGVFAMVKLVKLTANLPYLTFVLAFDDTVVSQVLAERYPDDGLNVGGGYLEKIVQVPLHVPAVDPARMRALFARYMRDAAASLPSPLGEAIWHDILAHLEPLIDAAPRTLRVAKRLANGVAFTLPLIADDVYPADFILLEGVRAMYPAVYRELRLAKLAIVGTWTPPSGATNGVQATVVVNALEQSVRESLGPRESDALMRLLQWLFPRLSGAGAADSGDEQRWARERRIASPFWFDRYFTFAEAPADVVVEAFADLRRSLELGKVPEAIVSLRGLVTNDPGGGAVATELARATYWESERATRSLVQAIVGVSDLLAGRVINLAARGMLSDRTLPSRPPWPDSPAAMLPLLGLVLRSLPPDARDSLQLDLVQNAPLTFGVQWWVYVADHGQGEPPLLMSKGAATILEALSYRCHQWMMKGQDIRSRDPDEVLVIMQGWVRMVGRHELSNMFGSNWRSSYRQPAELLDAIATALGIEVVENTAEGAINDIMREIDAIISPEVMIEPLNKVLQDPASGTTERERHASEREHLLANWFQRRHQK